MGFGDKVPLGIATGLSGTLMGTEVVTAIPAGTAFVPTAGDYYVRNVGANVTVQVLDSAGAWNNVTAAGVGGYFSFDGACVRLFNAGVGAQNVTLQKAG